MKKDKTAEKQKAQLKALATLLDEDSNTSDIPSEAERQRFLEGVNADFAALRNDPAAWQEELAERAAWDCTLADDLKDE